MKTFFILSATTLLVGDVVNYQAMVFVSLDYVMTFLSRKTSRFDHVILTILVDGNCVEKSALKKNSGAKVIAVDTYLGRYLNYPHLAQKERYLKLQEIVFK